MCHPMRTKARIASVKSYKIYVSFERGVACALSCVIEAETPLVVCILYVVCCGQPGPRLALLAASLQPTIRENICINICGL